MPTDDRPLAAVVPKPEADRAIEQLRREGVYDDDRRVREVADGVAVPVTAPPSETAVAAVVEQPDPEPRQRGLADRLRERGFSEREVERAPASWAVVGSVVLADFADCPREREREVGAALLDLHGEAYTILAREGVAGPRREPSVRVVAGRGETETVHVEHGTEYALDLAAVMFSPGNEAERVRMGEVVGGGVRVESDAVVGGGGVESGRNPPERVLDMFAGVGYFALPTARAGARVTAAEVHPPAFAYLLENARRNGVRDRVAPHLADCRDVAAALAAAGEQFDRVVMGHYDAVEREFLGAALPVLAPGGVVHLHAAVPEADPWELPTARLEAVADGAGRAVDVVGRRRVKTVDEGMVHVVVDARVN